MLTIKRFISAFTALLLVVTFISVKAVDNANINITADGLNKGFITDDNIYTYGTVDEIKIVSDNALYGVYIKFDRMPDEFTVTAEGKQLTQGTTDYLHHYIVLNGEKTVSIKFNNSASVADVFAFDTMDIPSWVQRWETLDKADIMVCPTHSDDDQLYFAGMLPWCAANGYYVQVVYFTNHWNTHDRPHELLDGLWMNGIKYYPVISELPDLYSASLDGARLVFGSAGYTDEFFVDFYIKLFERYKPLVVACHDIDGEYGHGAHMVNTVSVMSAVEESARKNIWDVKKTYIHLWHENKVVFNWDEPLAFFNGKSAFTISQESFECHKSQHRFDSLYRWINGTQYAPISRASEIRTYSPCEYGLYRSTVGMDSQTNGIFENLVTYSAKDKDMKCAEKACVFSANLTKNALLSSYKPSVYMPIVSLSDDRSTDSSVDIGSSNNKSSFTVFIVIFITFIVISSLITVFRRKFKWK